MPTVVVEPTIKVGKGGLFQLWIRRLGREQRPLRVYKSENELAATLKDLGFSDPTVRELFVFIHEGVRELPFSLGYIEVELDVLAKNGFEV